MGLIVPVKIETEKDGADQINAYFRVPRKKGEGFIIDDDYCSFVVEMRKDYDTRSEIDNGKKPMNKYNVIIYDILPNNIMIPNGSVYAISRKDLMQQENIDIFVEENCIEIGSFEALKMAIVGQFYEYIKTRNDFFGIDMTNANDHP